MKKKRRRKKKKGEKKRTLVLVAWVGQTRKNKNKGRQAGGDRAGQGHGGLDGDIATFACQTLPVQAMLKSLLQASLAAAAGITLHAD